MTRALVLAAVFCGAAAGLYAQAALQKEDAEITDVVQTGVLYSGSICSGDYQPGYADFYFRVIRVLKDGWIEVDYARSVTRSFSQLSFKPETKPLRMNVRRMCLIRVAELTQ